MTSACTTCDGSGIYATVRGVDEDGFPVDVGVPCAGCDRRPRPAPRVKEKVKRSPTRVVRRG